MAMCSNIDPEVFNDVIVLSDRSFRVAGEFVDVGGREPIALPGLPTRLPPTVSLLAVAMYSRFFSGVDFEALRSSHGASGDLVQALHAANAGTAKFQRGWIIERVHSENSVLAHRGRVRRFFLSGEYTPIPPPLLPGTGGEIGAFFSQEQATLQHGFYHVLNVAPEDIDDHRRMVRFYWNIRDLDGACGLVMELSSRFFGLDIPFRFKVVNSSELLNRRDTAVLLVPQRFYHIGARLVREIHHALRNHLSAEVPPFTKKLDCGLAFAEDPGNGESFGLNRCRLLSEAIWESYRKGRQDAITRAAAFRDAVDKNGFTVSHPYLTRSKKDWYVYDVSKSGLTQ